MDLLEITIRFFEMRNVDFVYDVLLPLKEYASCSNCDGELTIKSSIEKSQELDKCTVILFCEKCGCSEAEIILRGKQWTMKQK